MEDKIFNIHDESQNSATVGDTLAVEKIKELSHCSDNSLEESIDIQKLKNDLQNRIEKGKWTREEHEKFVYAILNFGNNWKKIEHHIQTRTSSQARSHAQKFLVKLKQKNVLDCKINLSLSAIGTLQNYCKKLDPQQKKNFVNLLNNLIFDEIKIERISLKKSNSQISNNEKNCNYYHMNPPAYPNCSSCWGSPNFTQQPNMPYPIVYAAPYQYPFYPNCYYSSSQKPGDNEQFPTYPSPHPQIIPQTAPAFYTMVYENGQYVYKPVGNVYNYFYPHVVPQIAFQAPIIKADTKNEAVINGFKQNAMEEKEFVSDHEDVTLHKKLHKKRLRLKKRPNIKIPEKEIIETAFAISNQEKKKKLRKKKLPEISQIPKEEKDNYNDLHSDNDTNEINMSNCICYHTPPNSEVTDEDTVQQINFVSSQPFEEVVDAGEMETFLKGECSCQNQERTSAYSNNVSINPKSSGVQSNLRKGTYASKDSGEKKEDLMNCFDPSF